MSRALLLTKLLRSNNISATNPATFLRRISSNTSSAASAELSSQSAPVQSAVSSSKRLENHPPTSTSSRNELNRDYTASHLVKSCGSSPKQAASTSEKTTTPFATPERSTSVLDLLRSHGFTSTQLTKMVRQYPRLLLLNAEEIILPKLEFLQSLGLSTKDLAQIVSCRPYILKRSLKNHIEPVCNWIKSLVQSDERVCTALKHSPWLLSTDHEKFLLPNIELLQKLQVPAANISLFLTHFPQILFQNHEQFNSGVCKVKEMGFDPSKTTFILAVTALSGKGKKQIWDRCYKIYSTKWGWSEEDILSAFKKHPHCMTFSDEKIDSSMDLLVNTMGWSSKSIAHYPQVLLYSLEKRMIPRCCVIRVLWTKGLLSKDLTPCQVLKPVVTIFLKRYVARFEKQVPQLLSVYNGQMDALDLQ